MYSVCRMLLLRPCILNEKHMRKTNERIFEKKVMKLSYGIIKRRLCAAQGLKILLYDLDSMGI